MKKGEKVNDLSERSEEVLGDPVALHSASHLGKEMKHADQLLDQRRNHEPIGGRSVEQRVDDRIEVARLLLTRAMVDEA